MLFLKRLQILVDGYAVQAVNARHTLADRAHQLIGDGIAERSIVRAEDVLAEDLDLVAGLHLREVGHVDHAHIHADAPDLLGAAIGREHFDLIRERAVQAVGVADGQDRDAAGPLRKVCAPIADGKRWS